MVCTEKSSRLSAKLEKAVTGDIVYAIGDTTTFPDGEPRKEKIPLVMLAPVTQATERKGSSTPRSSARTQDRPQPQREKAGGEPGWTFFRRRPAGPATPRAG